MVSEWDFLVCSYLWYQSGIGLNSFMGVYGSRDGIRVVLGLTRSWEYHGSRVGLGLILSWECSTLHGSVQN